MRSQPSEGNEGICMQSKWKDVPKSDINIFNFGKYNFWIEIRRGMASKNYRIKFILVSLNHFWLPSGLVPVSLQRSCKLRNFPAQIPKKQFLSKTLRTGPLMWTTHVVPLISSSFPWWRGILL